MQTNAMSPVILGKILVTFADLKKNLTRDVSAMPVRRLSILGDSATQFLAKGLKAYGQGENTNFEIFEAGFQQLNAEILDPDSELYHSNPEFIVLYLASERLWERFADTPMAARSHFHEQVVCDVQNWWKMISKLSRARIIQFNFIEINDGVFGNFAAKTPCSFQYQVRRLNLELMNLAQRANHVFIADVAGLSNYIGYVNAHDPRLYAASKIAFALDFLPLVCKAVVDIVKASGGSIKKCLVLDLDNTLWGGVIGDDGMENIQIGDLGIGHAYDALQRWAKELRRRGIILAICSKNNEATAKRPFQEHPSMILRLEDIALFIANWDNKVDNLKRVQKTLNIGFDSMVFVDDSAFERNMVRELLPAITTPELPEDPALYVPYLCSLNLFETIAFTEEDTERTRQYQEEIARSDFQGSFTSVEDYLRSLKMSSSVRAFDKFSVPRVAQLTQRSNQFNLRTVRYTEADIERIRASDEYLTMSFDLKDKFGDYGLIGLVILKMLGGRDAFIDTWIMSCRVLKRGMEEFILNQMTKQARQTGVQRLIGEYLPTAKNSLVKDLFRQMEFEARDGKWELDIQDFRERMTFIQPE